MRKARRLLLFLGCTAASFAATVFDNGRPSFAGPTAGYRSDFTDLESFLISGAKIELAAPIYFDAVNWWGFYSRTGDISSSDFALEIFPIENGVIAKSPAISQVMTSVARAGTGVLQGNGAEMIAFSSALSGASLNAGGYLVSIRRIQNNSTNWFWQLASYTGRNIYQSTPFYDWYSQPYTLAFNFTSISPPAQMLQSSADATTLDFSFNTDSGVIYKIQRSTDLTNWTTIKTVTGDGQRYHYEEPKTGAASFFRLIYGRGL